MRFKCILVSIVMNMPGFALAWDAELDLSKTGDSSKFVRFTKTNYEVAVEKITPVAPAKTGSKVSPTSGPAVSKVAGQPEFYVVLEGVLEAHDSSLLSQSKPIAQTQATPVAFKYKQKLSGRVTELMFSFIAAKGSVTPISLRIIFSDYENALRPQALKKWSVVPSLAFSYISYTETSVGTLSMFALTGKLSGNWRFAGRWELGANAFVTALPLWRSDTSRQTRFLGVNGRVGYFVLLSDPWAISLMGGWYYTTMLVSPVDHGFANMNGPQLFPVVYRKLPKGMGMAYFKFSPISLLNFTNYEIAGGLGYSQTTKPGQAWTVTLDIANIKFTSTDGGGGTRSTNSISISLGGGYQF